MSQVENLGNTATGADEDVSSSTFTLQVVSPSAGVNGPLSFVDLSTGTTVKQLKGKIRQSLSIEPSDDHQRLIHRGRLLAREDETMSEIFGQDTLKAPESHTLHLVLKPSDSESTRNQNITNATPQNAPPPPRPSYLPPPPPIPEILLQQAERVRRRLANMPADAALVNGVGLPPPPRLHTPPQQQTARSPTEQAGPNQQVPPNDPEAQLAGTIRTLQQEVSRLHHDLLNRRNPITGASGRLPLQNPLQPPNLMPSFQHLVAQQQRDRAALGMHGAQQQGEQQGGNPATSVGQTGHPHIQANRIVQTPQQTRMSSQEITGPNGDRWTVTVNETTTVYPSTAGPAFQNRTNTEASSLRDAQDVIQNIVRAMNANGNAQQPSTNQNDSVLPANSIAAAPVDAISSQLTGAPSRDVPNTVLLPVSNAHTLSEQSVPSINATSTISMPSEPTVYILSSPTGPRGLLVSPSENGLEAFYTPRRQVSWDNSRRTQQAPNILQGQSNGAQVPETQNRRHVRYGQIFRPAHQHAAGPARAVPGVANPANPPARPGAGQVWPQIWLIARLLVFVWFFTSGNSSWWRLIMISLVAFIIFLGSTGILDRIIEQFWGPIRRHLENLLPLAGPDQPQGVRGNQAPAQQGPGVVAPVQGQADRVAGAAQGATATLPPDPAQTAARLLEQRRAANGNWIWTQFRRLEHATILFVASLVPGVGERHIAARVAEENIFLEAERLRREADAANVNEEHRAPDARHENGANIPTGGTDTDDTNGVDTPTTDIEEGAAPVQSHTEEAAGSQSNDAGDGPVQPLVEV